jgi:hypothetical protein
MLGEKESRSNGAGEMKVDGFDPQELFGTAWWLTRVEKVVARQTSVRFLLPR